MEDHIWDALTKKASEEGKSASEVLRAEAMDYAGVEIPKAPLNLTRIALTGVMLGVVNSYKVYEGKADYIDGAIDRMYKSGWPVPSTSAELIRQATAMLQQEIVANEGENFYEEGRKR